jgi:DNA-binding response OmpR family regulator
MALSTFTRTVVIVEDDEEIRDILRLVFECDGYQVVGELTDGADALTMLLKLSTDGQPDFAVIDCRMPTQYVRLIARSLRSIRPQVRIVAFSPALQETPEWADSYLNQNQIAEASPLFSALLSVTVRA